MAVLASGGYGPMFGQPHTFRRSNRGKEAPFTEERFAAEVRRLYQVLTDGWTIVNASWEADSADSL